MATKKKTAYTEIEPDKKLIIPSFITGKKYYLYAHTREDSGEVFYFGIGTLDKGSNYYRAMCHKKRNNIWKGIVAKTAYTILIIEESDIKADVAKREIQYIALMGKKKDNTGTLSNLTDGGEGVMGHIGYKWTEEMKKAASDRLRLRKIKDSTRQKLRDNIYKSSLVGRKGKDSYIAKAVVKIHPITELILQDYYTISEAAEAMGVKPQSIGAAIKKQSLSKGYKWKYKNGN